MSYSALILGCGNIGALYDFDKPMKTWTHARAFSKKKGINFTVADLDNRLATKIARKYNTNVETISAETNFTKFDIVCVTSPTPTHFDYLKRLLLHNVPLIICEKPISASLRELNELARLYKKSGSKVLVNYIRRFQPSYVQLKKILSNRLPISACTGIIIKYQRGLLNNGGHAFDLLEFLFDKPIRFNRFNVQHSIFDAFSYDPTVSGSFNYEGCPVTILGVEANYPVFEIELFFHAMKIVICHSGNEVRFYEYKKREQKLVENQSLRQADILSHYMLPVINKAIRFLKNKEEPDNFLQAVELNKNITHVISGIKKKSS